jgi:hypothetical protein
MTLPTKLPVKQPAKHSPISLFNVRDYGATGKKGDNAQSAIQQAIDTCNALGGGMVYFPPGEYTSGTIHLRSHVRVFLEAGATLYSSKDPSTFDKRALFYGEDVENITLEGRGTVDGQADYEWKKMEFKDWYIYPNQIQAEEAGVPLDRSFPTSNSIGNLVLLIRCKDVRIESLSFLHSPSWTMHLFGCEHLVIEGLTIRTSQRDGVWADGIDPDGCKDVHISNCTIATGDDALVFYSSNIYGPATPCENITVTNCRLSSASSAIKFCDGNQAAIRNVTIDNCVITDSNRGIAFMNFDGGVLENIVISNLTIDCRRYDWFWWGDGDPIHFNLIQRGEIIPKGEAGWDHSKEPPVGVIRNVLLKNIIAHGKGSSLLHGHPDSPLENITLQNIRLFLSYDPAAHARKSVNAMTVENAHNFRLIDVEFNWQEPNNPDWQSALIVQNTQDLLLDGVSAKQAPESTEPAAIVLRNVQGAMVKDCKAQPGTNTFLKLKGIETCDIVVGDNNLLDAEIAVHLTKKVKKKTVFIW